MDVLKLNSISKAASSALEGYNLTDQSANPVGILVRSFNMTEYAAPSSLLAVARAGAGVNNIPHAEYAKKGICVFNTPGANANAVKEMIICEMIMAARNFIESAEWARSLTGDDVAKQVEKGKAQFAGSEIAGKTLCIIGLGAIGRKVACAANALGMEVVGYDPYLNDSIKQEIPFVTVFDKPEEAYSSADFITLHIPMTAETKGLISSDSISKMKTGVIILNAARGELAVIADVKEGVKSGKVRKYVCDFPTTECVGDNGIIALPHLGASTQEAEDNCALMAANELKDYIENGNILNSVNMPNIKAAKSGRHRASVISLEGTVLGADGVSATRNGITYTIIDSDDPIDLTALTAEGIIRKRNIY